MLAVCPACQKSIVVSDPGINRCKHCRAIIDISSPTSDKPDRVVSTASDQDEKLQEMRESAIVSAYAPPWENRGQMSLWRAFWQTWVRSVLWPTRFFSALDTKSDHKKSFWFGWLILSIAFITHFSFIAIFFAFASEEQYAQVMAQLDAYPTSQLIDRDTSATLAKMMLIFAPAFAAAYLFIVAGLSHAILSFLVDTKTGFKTTLKAIAYANSPMLFFLIPSSGALIAIPWTAVLSMIALAKVHRTDMFKSMLAVATPFLLCLFTSALLVSG